MADDAVIESLTHEEFDKDSKEFALDMEALFNLIEEDVDELIVTAEDEGWSIEKLTGKIEDLING